MRLHVGGNIPTVFLLVSGNRPMFESRLKTSDSLNVLKAAIGEVSVGSGSELMSLGAMVSYSGRIIVCRPHIYDKVLENSVPSA